MEFDTDVMPVFTKAGCNVGSCHGAAIGRGGFKLSLYGSDAAADYQVIVQELEGRRINLSHPEQSLLLRKPTSQIGHEGGELFLEESESAERILQWIRSGAARTSRRKLKRIEVVPSQFLIEGLNETVRLKTVAHFDNGLQKDVTRWTVFTPDDPDAVRVNKETGETTVLRRGRHVLTARYADQVMPLEILVPLTAEPVNLSRTERRSFIDVEVLKRLSSLRFPVSNQTDDATFLRRISLDLTGTLPDADEVRSFLKDRNPEKRDQLISRLLKSDEFVDYWTYQFAKLLRIRSQPKDTQGALTYHTWLRKQISQGQPYNLMVRELLTATGDSHTYGPANFYRTVGDARNQAEFASELFMGVRLRCANCHNHPLDKWSQDDYHGFAALFAKVQRGRVIQLGTRGEVTHPRTGAAAIPRIPGEQFLEGTQDGRTSFAEWLTDDTNPYLARAIVNRFWKAMMGRGLVEPADDLRDTNPATHPKLLQQLADDYVKHGYSIRHTLKLIAQSAAYQRSEISTEENRTDDRFYSHALSKPLEPEVLADAITKVTGVSDRYGDQPEGTRAITLFDSNIPSEPLDILGRCAREESCETPASSAGGLTRKLHLINGKLVNRKLGATGGRLRKLLASKKTNSDIIEEFYLSALGRFPTETESDYWAGQFKQISGEKERLKFLEDFLWGLLNCRQFVRNE